MKTNYFWTATYKDGTQMTQFHNGIERLFKEIDQDKLEYFSIKHFQKQIEFGINLSNGKVFLNGANSKLNFFNDCSDLRLIYFRQNRASITTGNIISDGSIENQPINHTCKHVIGFQTTKNGTNRKLLIFVENDVDEVEMVID